MGSPINSVQHIVEGLARVAIPKTVFYNPVQEFNRDLSVLALKAYIKHGLWRYKKEEKRVINRGGLRILDALSASGLRAIRYSKELGKDIKYVKKIVANDLSESAVKLINLNIKANDVVNLVESSLSDAIAVLNNSTANFDDTFHVIDIDPFGTGSQFFDAAVRSVGDSGMLMITCTDSAVLCGNSSEACFARYGSMSLKTRACHEMSLRIILKSLESHAAVYGRFIKPLLSLSIDFYVRLFVQVFEKQGETRKAASKLSLVYQCKQCHTFEFNPMGRCQTKSKNCNSINPNQKFEFKQAEVNITDRCQICGGRKNLGGPIWNGPIHDKEFIKLLIDELELEESKKLDTHKRMLGMIHICNEELDLPLMFNLDDISSCLKSGGVSYRMIASGLLNAGYQVSQSHASKGGFKTDAPNIVVWDMFCELADLHSKENGDKIEEQNTLKRTIMTRANRDFNKKYDYTYNDKCQTTSRQLDLMRFQRNPAPYWGPKAKPTSSYH